VTPLRIVLVMLEAPVPFGHAVARWSYVLLRELTARGHRVTAFAACSKISEIDEARRLFPEPEYDLRLYRFPSRKGFRTKLESFRRPNSYMFSPELKRDLQAELARGFDVLHLSDIWSGWVGLRHAQRALLSIHSLYPIDLAGVPVGGAAALLNRRLLYSAERRLVRTYPLLVTLSDRLRDGLAALNPRAEIAVIPLGIDSSLYPFIPDDHRPTEPIVTVIGSMNWFPTRSAAVRLMTRLWPGIKERAPSARVQLVGWGAREAMKEFAADPNVIIAENVPDTRPYFEQTTVMVYAPASGSGMKVKVLEALAYGVPVVTTGEGVEGLPAEDGMHAGISNDDHGLIDRAVRLLTDSAAANRQRAAGRRLVETHCGPGPVVDRFEALYRSLARSSA
jgi:glycosyltransferase involved in cell wall biosynthesis